MASAVTVESLLDEMTDKRALARWPSRPYTCHQVSSYDRASTSPNPDDGKFGAHNGHPWGVGWFANRDFNQFIRSEKKGRRVEHVLMDEKGPGAIVRWWTVLGNRTWRYPGNFRIYLDGSTRPIITMSVKAMVGGNGLAPKPFSYLASSMQTPSTELRGRNLYLPIPFARGCKITWDGNFSEHTHLEGMLYYNINYRRLSLIHI